VTLLISKTTANLQFTPIQSQYYQHFSKEYKLSRLPYFQQEEEEEEEEIYLPRTITILNMKNTILMLARSRLPEKQKAVYAGRQHC